MLPREAMCMLIRACMLFRMRVFGPLAACVGITWWLERKAGLRALFSSFLVWRVPLKWYLAAGVWKFCSPTSA
ncbi:MAG: hypothetical protein IPN85_18885 [Flavobacteriales bacterium]|nr:hypothetical protein [Flavobacteriales bacterium]